MSTHPGSLRHALRRSRRVALSLAAATATAGALAVATPAQAAIGELSRTALSDAGAPSPPSSIAIDDTTGRIYLSGFELSSETGEVTGKAAISVYDADGSFVRRLDLPQVPGTIVRVAADGPRSRLYVLRTDAAGSGATTVNRYSTTDLTAAPAAFIPAAAPDGPHGGISIAVDQSTGAATSGLVYVAYDANASVGNGVSGFVGQYSTAGVELGRIGAAGEPDPTTGAIPAGRFNLGQIWSVDVAETSHEVHVTSPTNGSEALRQRFTAATRQFVPGSQYGDGGYGPSFVSVGADGTWNGAAQLDAELGYAPFTTRSTANAVTRALGGSAPAAGAAARCRFGVLGVSAVAADDSVYVASYEGPGSGVTPTLLRLGKGGTGCGADPVVSDLKADVATPEVGQAVNLTATGTSPAGQALTYDWDLDGNPATGAGGFEVTGAPATQRVSLATFAKLTVRVRVRDADGSPSAVKSLPIDPKARVQAAFTASATSVVAGTAVTFDASASVLDQPATAYQWDLGGGTFDVNGGTAKSTVRTFDQPGTFTVRLRVTAGGTTAVSAPQTVTVTARAPQSETPPAGTPQPSPQPGPAPAPQPKAAVAKAASSMSGSTAKGLKLTVSCAAGGAACQGTITLRTTGKKPVIYARVRYSAQPGQRVTVTVKLKKAGKKALAKKKSAKAELLLTPDAGSASTSPVKIKLARK